MASLKIPVPLPCSQPYPPCPWRSPKLGVRTRSSVKSGAVLAVLSPALCSSHGCMRWGCAAFPCCLCGSCWLSLCLSVRCLRAHLPGSGAPALPAGTGALPPASLRGAAGAQGGDGRLPAGPSIPYWGVSCRACPCAERVTAREIISLLSLTLLNEASRARGWVLTSECQQPSSDSYPLIILPPSSDSYPFIILPCKYGVKCLLLKIWNIGSQNENFFFFFNKLIEPKVQFPAPLWKDWQMKTEKWIKYVHLPERNAFYIWFLE